MGYQANYNGRRFSKGTKALIWCRATGEDGITRCANCTKPVTRATSEFDHIVAYELCGYSGPSNGQLLCSDGPLSCHTLKSATQDWPAIAKNNRVRRGRKKPRHPLPCGRESRWSKPMHGAPVLRQSLAQRHTALMTVRQILTKQAEA